MGDAYGDLKLPAPVPAAGSPAGDPILATLLSFFRAVITADAGQAWQSIASGQAIVRNVFAHNPTEQAFRPTATPALYLWREFVQAGIDRTAGWRVRPSRLVLRWIPFMAGSQERLRRWEPFFNVIPSALDAAIERGRHPAWVHEGDTDPAAEQFGSLLWKYATVHKLELAREDVRRNVMTLGMEGNAPAQTYDVLDIPLALEELLVFDDVRYDLFADEVVPTRTVPAGGFQVGEAAADGGAFRIYVPARAPASALTPTLVALSPQTATVESALLEVTLTGTNFVVSSEALVAGQVVASTSVSPTEIKILVPASALAVAGPLAIRVRNDAPSGPVQSNALTFTVTPLPPELVSIAPTEKHLSDGVFTLYAYGRYFAADSILEINGVHQATTFIEGGEGLDQLTCEVQPLAYEAGIQDVQVTNDRDETTDPLDLYFDHAAPVIASLGVTSATAGDGDYQIAVLGSGFDHASRVFVDGVEVATEFADVDVLTAILPAEVTAVVGEKLVTVVNPTPGGGTSASAAFTVNYPVPSITSLAPTSALIEASNVTVTVTGTGVYPTTEVLMNGAPVTAQYIDATHISFAVLGDVMSAAGAKAVTLRNPTPGGGTSASATFTVNYRVPNVTLVAPSFGYFEGGAQVLDIRGSDFVPGTYVRVNGNALPTTHISATRIEATIPSETMAVAAVKNLEVVTGPPGGGTWGIYEFYAVHRAPVLTSIDPVSALVGDGDKVIYLTGTGFDSMSSAYVGATLLSTSYVSPTSLAAVIPASMVAVIGTKSVTVVNPTPNGGTSAAQTFTVVASNPTLTSLSVSSFERFSGQQSITATGTNFRAEYTVQIDGVTVPSAYVSATQFTVTIPNTVLWENGTKSIVIVGTYATTDALTITVTQPVSLHAEYRADKGRTMNGSTVQGLADQSGKGDINRNATNLTASQQPTYIASTPTYNGQPTLSFDSADHLASGTWTSPPVQPIRVYYVGHTTVTPSYLYDSLTVTTRRATFRSSASTVSVFGGTQINSTVWDGSSKAVLAAHYQGTSTRFAVNAKTFGATFGGGSQNPTGITLGSSFNLTTKQYGPFGQYLEFDAATMPAPMHNEVVDYLGWRFGVTIGA